MAYIYENCKVVNVVDGDTIDIEISIGFGIKKTDRFRIKDLDTYEIRLGKKTTQAEKDKGLKARKEAMMLLLCEKVKIQTYKDKKGKYGRYLCSIELPRDQGDYATAMKLKGFDKNT